MDYDPDVNVKFIAFYHNVFFRDKRLLKLTAQEKQQYLWLLMSTTQTEAILPEDYNLIAGILGTTPAKAKALIHKLVNLQFFERTPTGEKMLTLASPKMVTEYNKSYLACKAARDLAQQRAYKRHHPDD